MTQAKKTVNPKVTIIASKGANQTINYLLEDRDELEWLVAIGRNKNGDIFFYDTGGDIIQDLGHALTHEAICRGSLRLLQGIYEGRRATLH